MTEGEYLKDISWGDCPYQPHGYGFRDDLVGSQYWWHSPHSTSRSSYPRPGYRRELAWEWLPIPKLDRYRFAKIECPICLLVYVGWYCHSTWTRYADGTEDQRYYELYDTSFYWAFNDEPGEKDIANLREFTPEQIKAALTAWPA